MLAVAAVVAAAHVVVVDAGGGADAVAAAVAAANDAGDHAVALDATDAAALEGCAADDCYVEVAAAHGAEFVVVVRKDGVVDKFDVGSSDVVAPAVVEPPPTTTPPPAVLPPPAPKGPPAATRPPRDERPISSTGTTIQIVGGVGAGLGVVVMGLGAVSLLQPGASAQHTTGLALVGGGGLVAVAGCVAYGIGETLRE